MSNDQPPASFRTWLGIYARGLCMGVADMVPGVSGGTMALVTGIYYRLIAALAAINLRAFKLLLGGGATRAWRQVDGTFLTVLLAGILSSVFAMSHLVIWLFETHPVLVLGFFLGVLLVAVILIAQSVHWDRKAIALSVLMLFLALAIVVGSSATITPSLPWLFLGGCLAITAMILPGISGSLILLMLGLYTPAVEAVRTFDVVTLLVFASGCATGIMLFSRILQWILKHYENLALAGMTGIVTGSMIRLWPWQLGMGESTALHLAWPADGGLALQGLLALALGMLVYGVLHALGRRLRP